MATNYPYNTAILIRELKTKFNIESQFNSFISKTVPGVDIPDPENLQVSFVYNFFTPDERKVRYTGPGNQIITLSTPQTNDAQFQQATDRLPRAVKLKFSPVVNYNRTELTDANVRNYSVRENLNKILIEGSTSNRSMQGFELIDTLSDLIFYDTLQNTMVLENITEQDSNVAKANRLADLISSDSLFGNDKKLILDALGNMQAQGVQSLDATDADQRAASDLSANQSFSMKFNKLFFEKISKTATLNVASVFEDEIRSLISPSSQITQRARAVARPSRISNDTDFEVPHVEMLGIRNQDIIESGEYPKVTLIGYIIQRTEISNNGTPVNLEPIFVEDIKTSEITDSNVRYGYTYVYKIRAVALVEAIGVRRVPGNPGATQPVIVKFLLASEGSRNSVNCVEKNPPPPPTNLKFRMHQKFLKPVLTWTFPINPTRDIKKFQVFKRSSINTGFTLLREFDFDNSEIKSEFFENVPRSKVSKSLSSVLSFIDQDFELGSSPIYAVVSLDAHGMTSGYSAQFQIRYDRYSNKLIKTLISKSGAPKPYPNIYLNVDTFKDAMKTSGYSRLTLVFDPEYYAVTKRQQNSENETDLGLIAVSNDNNPKYKLQIINTDFQEAEVLNIKIRDASGPAISLPAAALSAENLSFEFNN
jgi:hypothetical protein